MISIAAICAAILIIGSFSYVALVNTKLPAPNLESNPIQESEAVSLPADISLISEVHDKRQGNLYGGFLIVEDNVINTQRNCEFCTLVEYSSGTMPQEMETSWTMDRNYDLKDAKKITFYAAGYDGGETVTFKSNGKKQIDASGKQSKNPNFDIKTKPVVLKKDWQKFEIDISKANKQGVTDPFGLSFKKDSGKGPVIIFVKGLRLEGSDVTRPLPVEATAS
jgi:hypothetical protein